MFPTHVGMNRVGDAPRHDHHNVPHTRGDEPNRRAGNARRWLMFPTHVGMNRTRPDRFRAGLTCSPHTWG
mgnify:CR=1 FL=1